MCEMLKGPPRYAHDRGVVYRTDELGEAAMLLSDFVAAVQTTSGLARKWVAEANQPDRVRALEGVKVAEPRHS